MHDKSIRALSQALKTKEFSSTELTTHYLKRIKQHSALNAFISIDEHYAMESAKAADACLKQGNAPLLTGIPLAHKDIFCTEQSTTTCGSKMLGNYKSPYAATIVKRLSAVDTVTLGKTNMDEFGMGSGNQNSYFGPVKNPWDITRVPGGSSGGSAAAVSASLVSFATGSDTGGSIRQPAAFCGVSGIKPTYGLASRFGMVAFASSLDQAGPIAHSVDDLALILQVMAGFDEKDSTSINKPLPDFTSGFNQSKLPLRIGLPSGFFQSDVNEDVQNAVKNALKIYEEAGAEIIEIDLSLQKLWVPCYYMIACAESSSNLSRYDGMRYGHRAPKSQSIQDLITQSRDEGFGVEVKRRILAGTCILSAGHFDDHYIQAQKIRRMIQDELLNALSKVDVILGPTTPSCAFKIDSKLFDPTEAYLADSLTVAANLAGLPALSIPVGLNPEGLPIGMQMMGNHFSEERLLATGHFYQQHTDWHTLRPEAFK